ncbi:MAG: magnesium transporter CorA family protein [Candidatus Moraniibacteriota bacterium]|jgi:magnesium transporter
MKIVSHENITWIDIENPSMIDVDYIRENFSVHPLAVEEFITPTYRARATKYSNCLFLTIHIPLFDNEKRTTYAGEIDILLTKTHLITGHTKDIYQLEQFFNKLHDSEGARRLFMAHSTAHLLYELFKILTESCFPRLDHVTRHLDEIQEGVFNGSERQMVREISVIKRDILNFRRTLMPQRSIIESIIAQSNGTVPKDIKMYYRDLIGTNIRLWNDLESAKETIESLEKTNNSLLSEKINQRMRIITVFSVLWIPITIYLSFFSLNVDGMPLQDNPYAIFIHLFVMLGISASTFLVFKLARWI